MAAVVRLCEGDQLVVVVEGEYGGETTMVMVAVNGGVAILEIREDGGMSVC